MTMMGKRKRFTPAGKILYLLKMNKTQPQSDYQMSLEIIQIHFLSFSFRYCTDTKTTFTTSLMLKNHISLMHGIKNPDLGQMPKTAVQESKKALRKVAIQLYLCIKPITALMETNVHKGCGFCDLQGLVSDKPAADSREEGQDRTLSPEAPPAKRQKTQFRCSKCGFLTESSAQFKQHIPQHKTDENTPQCLHCGLCFTSVLSLNRHLFIVHKVKGPNEGKKEGEEDEMKVREKEQVNRPVSSADTEEFNDLLPELIDPEASQAGETASLHCDKTSDCSVKLSAHSQTQAVSASVRPL